MRPRENQPQSDVFLNSIGTHKTPQVPQFGDEDTDFKEWWFLFKSTQPRFNQLNDNEKWAAVALKLKGKAREYWTVWWKSTEATFGTALNT